MSKYDKRLTASGDSVGYLKRKAKKYKKQGNPLVRPSKTHTEVLDLLAREVSGYGTWEQLVSTAREFETVAVFNRNAHQFACADPKNFISRLPNLRYLRTWKLVYSNYITSKQEYDTLYALHRAFSVQDFSAFRDFIFFGLEAPIHAYEWFSRNQFEDLVSHLSFWLAFSASFSMSDYEALYQRQLYKPVFEKTLYYYQKYFTSSEYGKHADKLRRIISQESNFDALSVYCESLDETMETAIENVKTEQIIHWLESEEVDSVAFLSSYYQSVFLEEFGIIAPYFINRDASRRKIVDTWFPRGNPFDYVVAAFVMKYEDYHSLREHPSDSLCRIESQHEPWEIWKDLSLNIKRPIVHRKKRICEGSFGSNPIFLTEREYQEKNLCK